ncbi:MAG TPA: YfhO family protein [Promineifilum sp.]|nr:YfhO family protein [Promineifilum sp.]HRQ13953.1 YfhO family protein [Promineifilum sp.]
MSAFGRTAVVGRLSRLAVPVALVALVLLFFNKMAFSNLILARGDTFLYFYPYWTAAAEALRSGRVPLWNPDIFMGAPMLANSQVGFFYPLNWPIWLFLPTPYAVSASILIHLSIAGLGAYLAGRRSMGLGRAAALFAAALFALGGYLTAQVEHINQLQGLAWLPWYFAVLTPVVTGDGARQWRTLMRGALGVGILFALQLLAGHTQTAFISGVAISLWALFHWLTDARAAGRGIGVLARAGLVIGAGVALAALLAAVQLLPTLELAGQSSRQGGLSLNEVLSFSWHPLHMTRALLPAYGAALFSEYVAFLPLTALALAVVGTWGRRKRPGVLPWVLLALMMILLALGRFTPVYYLLGRVPGFDLFRVPARWLAVAALAVALLAGHGWERLRRFAESGIPTDERREEAREAFGRPLAVARTGLLLLIAWGYVAGWVARWVPTGAEAPFETPALLTLLGWLIEFVLASLLLWVILTAPSERARRATTELVILALAVLWLGSRSLPYNQLTTLEAYFDWRPPQARLAALATCAVPERPCAAPPDRFLSLSNIFFDPGDLAEIEGMYAGQLDPSAIYDYVVAVKHKEVLSPNLSMIHGLPSIDGFDGGILPLATYSELMRLILPEGVTTADGRLREYLTAAPDARWLSLFNGRYLVTDKTGDLWREGVFFDRQHPTRIGAEPVLLADVPTYEATELWMLAEAPPEVEVITAEGESWRLTPELWQAPDLYRLDYPRAATAERVTLLPCPEQAAECGVNALTLVDARDETFLPLTMPPYRLIFSGDVKIYENLDALPRAFLVHEWQVASDTVAAVAMMRAGDFEPGLRAVVTGENVPSSSATAGRGSATIVDYRPEVVTLHTEADAESFLILTDAIYPGWEAAIDGVPVSVWSVDGLFRGVFVPAGDHEIVMSFRPDSYRRGLGLSAAGILMLIVLGLLLYQNRERTIPASTI